MASTRVVNRSFSGGEMSPEMFGRFDDAKFQTGAALLQNFICKPSGAAKNRPGFAYVNTLKLVPSPLIAAVDTASRKGRLFPFTYSTTQTMVLQIGTATAYTSTTATSTDATHLTKAGAGWATDAYVGMLVVRGDGSFGTITTNSATVLTIAGWSGGTDTTISWTGSFTIDRGYFRFYTSGSTLLYSRPNLYIAPQAVTAITNSAGGPPASAFTTSGAHGLTTGDPIVITMYDTGGAAPALPTTSPQIAVATTYYAIVVDATHIQIATTKANAVATTGTGFGGAINISFTTTGSIGDAGDMRVHYAYQIGDLVRYTPAGTTYHFYCYAIPWGSGSLAPHTDRPPTDAAFWYIEPGTDGTSSTYVLEVPHSYCEADFFDIGYTQSGDVMTFVHSRYPASELRRLGASDWTFTSISFSPTVSPPTSPQITSYLGAGYNISAITNANPGTLTTYSRHGLVAGDSIYIRGAGTTVPDGRYIVGDTSTINSLTLRDVLLGKPFDTTATGAYTPGNGTLYFASLSSDSTNDYVVTSIGDHGEESIASSVVSSTYCNLYVPGATNTISWTAPVIGAAVKRYKVYKKQTGLYGYIGQSETLSFVDDNIGPSLDVSPPLVDSTLNALEFPGAAAYYEQRRVFSATRSMPQDTWLTKSGTESDMTYSLPTTDTDRIYFRVASREASTIRHVVPLQQLLLLSSSAEYRVSPSNGDALTPSNVSVRPQSYIGSSTVRPIIVNNSVVFCAARGGHVREMGYNWQAQGYVTGDLSLRAIHLFDALSIVDSAYSRAPLPVLWFVSSSGKLLGFTYAPEEQIGGWHQHTTDGVFESCAVVSEGSEDRLYVVVARSIKNSGGATITVRNVEEMGPQFQSPNVAASFFVDAGALIVNGAPSSSVTGQTQLAGKTVALLVDGVVQPQQTMSNTGTLTLATSGTVVVVGLPYVSAIQTLPVAMQIDGYGQGRAKSVNSAWIRVSDTSSFKIGPDINNLSDSLDLSATAVADGEVYVMPIPFWSDGGQIYILQDDPLPLTVVGTVFGVAIGG